MSFGESGEPSDAFTKEEMRRKLFRSPNVDGNRYSPDSTPITTLVNQLQIEHDLKATYKRTRKEMHLQRLNELRQKLKTLNEDDWRYPPIDKLIGLN